MYLDDMYDTNSLHNLKYLRFIGVCIASQVVLKKKKKKNRLLAAY